MLFEEMNICAIVQIVVLVLIKDSFGAERIWRDPHELVLNKPSEGKHIRGDPNEIIDNPQACEMECNNEATVLKYYKRSLRHVTKHLQKNRLSPNVYDFNLHIGDDDYATLIQAIDNVDYDIKKLLVLDEALLRIYGNNGGLFDIDFLSWTDYLYLKLLNKQMSIMLLVVAILLIVYRLYTKATRVTIVFVILLLLWALDFGLTWMNKIEDSEVDNMIDLARYESAPPTCDLSKMYWYERWFSQLSPTEECSRYYKARYKKKDYEITPTDILVDQLGKTFRIGRFVAIESSAFLSLLTSRIPWPLNWIVIILAVLAAIYLTIVFTFILFGYSFELNFAHLFKIKMTNQHMSHRQARQIVEEIRESIIQPGNSAITAANVNSQSINDTAENENPPNNPSPTRRIKTSPDIILSITKLNRAITITTEDSNRSCSSKTSDECVNIQKQSTQAQNANPECSKCNQCSASNVSGRQNSKEEENVSSVDDKMKKEEYEVENSDDTGSESIEICGDSNINDLERDFELVVNEGYGDTSISNK